VAWLIKARIAMSIKEGKNLAERMRPIKLPLPIFKRKAKKTRFQPWNKASNTLPIKPEAY